MLNVGQKRTIKIVNNSKKVKLELMYRVAYKVRDFKDEF